MTFKDIFKQSFLSGYTSGVDTKTVLFGLGIACVIGLYILHPNNVGRCGHISNASYAVKGSVRGRHIGEQLVMHSLTKGRELGFKRFFRRHHPAISSAMKFLSRRRRPKKRGRQ